MYERSYGYRYGEVSRSGAGGWLGAADIAKLIRRDIKEAVAEGLLPGAPVTYSVTSENYSMGRSINVTVKNWPGAWQDCDGTVPGTRRTWDDGSSTARGCPNVWCAARNDPERAAHATPHIVLTEEARAAEMTLERIHGAYNYDGSETQVDYFDVNYYGQVSFESPEGARFRAEHEAKIKARKAATDSGEVIGKVVNYSSRGRTGRTTRVVHVAVKLADGRERLACGASLRGYSMGVAKDDAEVTCSRCAKRTAVAA